ncbi:hypothetical protein [Clostridium saccharobutylicum]|uniref:Uncharacterized protein n=1 Tax=Clostridium saccharobutylicum TaxID=169679 RepID=A0A1S8MQK0_CLOSA|nr:hypothetical protein [Clostridium saccharobutylicum]OOM06397.1 hypothetical protein CLOSAC_43170 [Clostridium saccharobutylicum]
MQALPIEVQEVIKGILEILDTEYGANRDKYVDDGGYIIATESIKDLNEIKKKTSEIKFIGGFQRSCFASTMKPTKI